MNKLKLKEKPQSDNQPAIDLSKGRYAKPKPPTIVERLFRKIKKILPAVIFTAVLAGAFMLLPFQRFDEYEKWEEIRNALTDLDIQPDSYSKIQRVSALAHTNGFLWTQPKGSRPEKWHQYFKRMKYDAKYGLIQVLALGLIQHGKENRGLSELRKLQQRTSFKSQPDLPATAQVIKTCTKCRNGKIQKKCPECGGSGICSRCKGKGTIPIEQQSSFPSGRLTLENTRNIKSKALTTSKKTHRCPVCNGTGKCTECQGTGKITTICPVCGGKITIITAPDKISGIYHNSIKSSLLIIKTLMLPERIIHEAVSVQQIMRAGCPACGHTRQTPGT
ncbi:MAG: hypothetical protein R6V06_07205 [Kiritimatiellia bacterium]